MQPVFSDSLEGDATYFIGGTTYEQLTAVLSLLAPRCEECSEPMLLICLEPKCGNLYCQQCQLLDHLCHRTNELQMALVGPRILSSSRKMLQYSHLQLVEQFVLPCLQEKIEQDMESPSKWSSVVDFFLRRRDQMRWLDMIATIGCQAVALYEKHGEACAKLKEWPQCQLQFRQALSHINFSIESEPQQVDEAFVEEVWRFAGSRLDADQHILEPQWMAKFLHCTRMGQSVGEENGTFVLPVSRLRPLQLRTYPQRLRQHPERLALWELRDRDLLYSTLRELILLEPYRGGMVDCERRLPQLQSLSITFDADEDFDFPSSLWQLTLRLTPFYRRRALLERVLLHEVEKLVNLRSLICEVAFARPFFVDGLIHFARKHELRAFTLHSDSSTALNAHNLAYRRKLMQAALLQRSRLQTSYFAKFLLESLELQEETTPLPKHRQQYQYRESTDRWQPPTTDTNSDQDYQYSGCPCCGSQDDSYPFYYFYPKYVRNKEHRQEYRIESWYQEVWCSKRQKHY